MWRLQNRIKLATTRRKQFRFRSLLVPESKAQGSGNAKFRSFWNTLEHFKLSLRTLWCIFQSERLFRNQSSILRAEEQQLWKLSSSPMPLWSVTMSASSLPISWTKLTDIATHIATSSKGSAALSHPKTSWSSCSWSNQTSSFCFLKSS